MSTLNISLPTAMKTFVATQVHRGLYSSASDYVRTLIRADQQQDAEATCAATRLADGGRAVCAGGTPAWCAWLRTRLGPARQDDRPAVEQG